MTAGMKRYAHAIVQNEFDSETDCQHTRGREPARSPRSLRKMLDSVIARVAAVSASQSQIPDQELNQGAGAKDPQIPEFGNASQWLFAASSCGRPGRRSLRNSLGPVSRKFVSLWSSSQRQQAKLPIRPTTVNSMNPWSAMDSMNAGFVCALADKTTANNVSTSRLAFFIVASLELIFRFCAVGT